MFKIISLALFLGMFGLFSISSAWAGEGMLFSVNSMDKFEVGQNPFIYGTATDYDGNPLSGVEIQANFPTRVIMATTDSAGEFSITSPVPAELGMHTVTVYATKNKMSLNTQVTYEIIDRQQIATSDISKSNLTPDESIPKTSNYDNSKYDLFSRTILEQIKEQKTDDAKKKILSENQQRIIDQKLQVQTELENDLKSFEKQNEFHTPRNAFLRFLADIDNSVKNLFWNQFLFTEKKTDDAHKAKIIALEEGKSSVEAMKIFQQKAAITQNEIIEYNENLSKKYGNATSSVQEPLDEENEIPLEE